MSVISIGKGPEMVDKKTMRQLNRKVRRGEEWLDEHAGPEWRDLIDLDTLDAASINHSVLGQLAPRIIRGTGDKKRWWGQIRSYLKRMRIEATPGKLLEEASTLDIIGEDDDDPFFTAPYPTMTFEEAESKGFWNSAATGWYDLNNVWETRIRRARNE